MEGYETRLGYLEYEGTSDRISIPIQIRERHLTPETERVLMQAIGPELQLSIWSERDNIIIRLPLSEWQTTKAYEGTLSGANKGLLSVGRFDDAISNEGDEVPARIAVHFFDEP